MSPVISPSELNKLPPENLIILDARAGKDSYEKYLSKHIKGARFIDLDEDLADQELGEESSSMWEKKPDLLRISTSALLDDVLLHHQIQLLEHETSPFRPSNSL